MLSTNSVNILILSVFNGLNSPNSLKTKPLGICLSFAILTELVESILPSKIVIFAHYTYSIEQIAKTMDKAKIPYMILNGNTKDKEIWKKFQESPDVKVFISQYKSGSEGIDLFAAPHMIFYEPTDTTRILTQATDRIHRIGLEEPANYYHLITKGTIEEIMYQRLEKGEDFNVQYLREVVKKGGFEYPKERSA
jgi:SNF2 family DNA or RNA helicase